MSSSSFFPPKTNGIVNNVLLNSTNKQVPNLVIQRNEDHANMTAFQTTAGIKLRWKSRSALFLSKN